MKRLESRHQLSRKGVSDVFVYMIILLIALFSGMIVYMMASSLINEYILRTLGLRLTIHGLGLYYNTMYSMPPGQTNFITSFPSQCVMKCIDCTYYTDFFHPFPTPICNCDNSVREGGGDYENILDSDVDEYSLVCDDYVVQGIKPVILYLGREPVSGGVKINLRVHPYSQMFTDFVDGLLEMIGSESRFFEREITVFSEMPVNLNDYSGVRFLLTSPPSSRGMIAWNDERVGISKHSYDNFESTIKNDDSHGLLSLLTHVFNHTSNVSVPSDQISDYCLKTSDDSMGVRCPGTSGVTYELILKPGLKIKQVGKQLCEYECNQQNTLESECQGEWNEVFCFDFSEVESPDRPGCAADDFEYNLDICGGTECVGTTSIDYLSEDFYYIDVVRGTRSFLSDDLSLGPIDLTLQSTECTQNYFLTNAAGTSSSDYNDLLSTVTAECPNILSGESISAECSRIWSDFKACRDDYASLTVEEQSVCDNSGYINCDELELEDVLVSETKSWRLSPNDCSYQLMCNLDNPEQFSIIINDVQPPSCQKEIFSGFCETIGDAVRVERFVGCSSKGTYDFFFSDETNEIIIEDLPSVMWYKSLLAETNLVSETYRIIPFGDCSDPENFHIELESINESDTFSKMVWTTPDNIQDQVFELELTSDVSSTPKEFDVTLREVSSS